MNITRKYPKPKDAKLSVIIPAYNAENWMQPTLKKLWLSLSKSQWKHIEIIVVDDGSKDKTAEAAEHADIGLKVKVIKQKNAGRFIARKTGLEAAIGDYVFFIDSRVFAHQNSFNYLAKQMSKNPKAVVWNGHVEVERQGNPYARFWHAVTYVAWRGYMARPRLVHYGLSDLEYYPKGTTCFFAPKDLFIKAYKGFKTGYKDYKNANDDTALIRIIAAESDLYMSPQFSFTYHSRSTLKAFMKHTVHRGVVFIDGFLRRGGRYSVLLTAYLFLVPLFSALIIIKPLIA